ncbi:phosphodiester glycosidase family protein [Clostridium sp. WILCCON 0269]|uniref:Phosphodiester glycosidase family protein n=1 Tax=Candidatus Clostridium eludens TaxID=3381663 RepID=A0ABW8SJ44_9CLOT
MGNLESKGRKKKKKKKSFFKSLIIFLAYELIVVIITAPVLIFYGPFKNVKSQIVGTAMATFSHQYIATIFLSQDEITKILNQGQSGETTSEEKENPGSVSISHVGDNNIKRYDINNRKFDGYILEINDPKRIKVGYTSKLKEVGERTSEIAERNGAVAAINGGGFTDKTTSGKLWVGTGAYPEGIVISGGKLIYSDVSSREKINVTAFTSDGRLIVGDHTLQELLDKNVVEAISFRNSLIINGKTVSVENEGLNPRTAIGQKADGTIVMLVVDGRKGLKPGASLKEIQNILLQQGVVNASNLDGGSSTTMYLNGEVINDPCDWNGERTVATALYVKP